MTAKIWAFLAALALCSVCFAGTASAAKTGYGFTIGGTELVDPTINGIVAAGEWDTDSYKDWLYNGWTQTTSFFNDKWGALPTIGENWLVECLSDTTNDADDYFKICVDCGAGFTDPPAGGTAPSATCWMLTVMGNGTTAMQKGTGTDWGAFAEAVSGTDYIAATAIAASPTSATPHRAYEVYLDKGTTGGTLGMGYSNNVRLEVYDVSTEQTLMWPPESSANVPDTYGAGTSGSLVPDGLTISLMLALSSVAAAVSILYFRTTPKIRKLQ